MSAVKQLFEIANTLAGQDVSVNYDHTFTGAFDALTDTLAGHDVQRGATISEAIKAAAPYISGGSSQVEMVNITLQPQIWDPSDSKWVDTRYKQEEYEKRTSYEFYPLYDLTDNKPITDFTVSENSQYDTYTLSVPAGHIVEIGNMFPNASLDQYALDDESHSMIVLNNFPYRTPLAKDEYGPRHYNRVTVVPSEFTYFVIYAKYKRES